MSAHCHDHCQAPAATNDPRYRRILWLALCLNAVMFVVELVSGLSASSVSLLADAIDFFGDAANYGVSLLVLSMGALARGRAALLKGACMGLFGVFVLVQAAWAAYSGVVPEPFIMGWIGLLALAVNVLVAAMLYAWREGDANMRSVWLCSRNDAIGNLAVIAAAFGVWSSHTAWPDLGVAVVMGLLALSSAWSVWRQARGEMAQAKRLA
ncbi:MAG: cation transporter [Burkholderiaceae bacterium]